jgi:hypothetical protein
VLVVAVVHVVEVAGWYVLIMLAAMAVQVRQGLMIDSKVIATIHVVQEVVAEIIVMGVKVHAEMGAVVVV